MTPSPMFDGQLDVAIELYTATFPDSEIRTVCMTDELPPRMHVRPVRSTDRDEWIRMLLELYPRQPESEHAPSVDAFLAGTSTGELLPSAVFVCERPAGGLAGFLELSVRDYAEGCTGPTPYVESWYVDAGLRGRGVGRSLVAAAEEWARDRGFSELASNAELENPVSHRAHGAAGFAEVERTVHFRKPL